MIHLEDPKLRFGYTVRTYRRKRSLTQERLAESLNISTRQISRIENGLLLPSGQLVFILGKELDISLDELKQYF